MPQFSTRRHVRHPASDMFDLVADIERYPEFLPLCESLRVLRDAEAANGTTVRVAEMGVGYKAIRERFTTRVTLDPDNRKITAEYIDGPFRHLENRWSFRDDGRGGCDVDFFITYEFKSRTLGLLMGTMFDRAFRKFTDAFESRARTIYGAPA